MDTVAVEDVLIWLTRTDEASARLAIVGSALLDLFEVRRTPALLTRAEEAARIANGMAHALGPDDEKVRNLNYRLASLRSGHER